jgi:hypothetical protein
MNPDQFPLSCFEVVCDGSACGSGNTGPHIHPPQDGLPAVGRVRVEDGQRAGYEKATGLTRLEML